MRFTAILTAAVSLLLAFIACHSTPSDGTATSIPEISDTTIVRLYRLGADGHYTEYVAQMASCNGTTDAYRNQIILALKHRNDCVHREKGGVADVTVQRIEFHDNGRMANAFLRVSYNDHTHEELLFPLVCMDGTWMMQ